MTDTLHFFERNGKVWLRAPSRDDHGEFCVVEHELTDEKAIRLFDELREAIDRSDG